MFKRIFGLSKEQRKLESFRENQELLLNDQVTEPQTQLWLEQNYPKELRKQVKSLEIIGRGLVGLLDLVDFSNLEELYCYDNQLTGIRFSDKSFEKLRVLHVGDNNFPEQGLLLFSNLIGLEVLNLRNNSFKGDLESLKNLINLQALDVSDTDIDSGLIHLTEKLESLFCQVEKEAGCWKIREELKNYELGNDCYDFQSWKREENWLVIPGSWPKSLSSQISQELLEEETLKKEKELNEIYQKLASVGENSTASLENDIKKIREQKQSNTFAPYKFGDKVRIDLDNLALVAERYMLANKKIWILEEEIKKLKQENDILADKNEFWKFLQLELTKQDEKAERIIDSRNELSLKIKYNKNTINIMTNTSTNNTNKIYILEWNSAELKDGTSGKKIRYEKFEVIAGSEKEELKFYSTFFTGNNKFKRGEIYELSVPGNFVQDSAEIIQGVDSGGYEFEKVAPSLMIKELWEGKESNLEKINVLEESILERKNDINKINEKLISKEREFDDLQSRFDNLQIEKNKLEEEKEKTREELNSTKAILQKKEQELTNSESKATRLQNQVTNFENEKEKMKKNGFPPEEKTKLIQEKDGLNNKLKSEKENLNEQFKKERRSKQLLIETLEELRGQKLKETIEEKLTEKKDELEKLETKIVEKLGDNQKSLLENFLEKQEDFDTALFDDVSQTSRSFLRAKEKLQDARVKLIAKVSSEEVEELCRVQTEIGKLEVSKKQWEKMEEQQKKEEQEQYESFIETPPTTPKNN